MAGVNNMTRHKLSKIMENTLASATHLFIKIRVLLINLITCSRTNGSLWTRFNQMHRISCKVLSKIRGTLLSSNNNSNQEGNMRQLKSNL